MKIIKKVQGHDIELDYRLDKKYPRYNVFNVYKDNVFLYRTCLTDLQIKDLVLNGYVISEDETRKEDILEEEDLICLL